jgi:hypothetical protein
MIISTTYSGTLNCLQQRLVSYNSHKNICFWIFTGENINASPF